MIINLIICILFMTIYRHNLFSDHIELSYPKQTTISTPNLAKNDPQNTSNADPHAQPLHECMHSRIALKKSKTLGKTIKTQPMHECTHCCIQVTYGVRTTFKTTSKMTSKRPPK